MMASLLCGLVQVSAGVMGAELVEALRSQAQVRGLGRGVEPAMPAPRVQPSASSTMMNAPVARCSR